MRQMAEDLSADDVDWTANRFRSEKRRYKRRKIS
jgi:hypothetical protein